MKSQLIKDIYLQLDLKLILKSLIIAGCFFMLLSYPFSSYLTSTLAFNLGAASKSNSILITNSNFKPSILELYTDKQPHIKFNANSCSLITKDDIILTKDNGILTLLNQSISLETIGGYDDLVYLRDYQIDTNEFTRLRKEPAEMLRKMISDAHSTGIKIFISSGYRTYTDQVGAMDYWIGLTGYTTASKFAAKPGFSEHHLGTTVDILTYENSRLLLPSYTKTKLYKWLKNNAYLYGFIESYPENTTQITGYSYEPWHYRYIGVELATKLKSENILLQDYLYRLNSYCLVE